MNATQGLQIDLDRLVRLVLDDLGPGSASVPLGNVNSPRDREDRGNSESLPDVPEKTSCLAPARAVVPESTDLRLTQKVITVSVVQAYQSNPSRRWILPPGAFLTPAAKDELRGRNIEIVCSSRQAVPDSGALQVNHEVQRVQSSFVLALHGTGKEPLLPSYVSWAQEKYQPREIRKSCIIETTNELREIFSTEKDVKGLIVTQYPALALVLANRMREFRCCAARDLRQLEADAPLLGANLLVVDPKETSVFLLRQMTKWFMDSGKFTEPDFLTGALR